MSSDNFFIVSERKRVEFIDSSIVNHLPESIREGARKRVVDLINNYAGQDLNALSVLAYAAEQKRFDEFAGGLERYYTERLHHISPENRRADRHIEDFFIECYSDLGIKL